jgi:hypothetical protein
MVSKRVKKKKSLNKEHNRFLRESLRDFLGHGLLDSKSKRPASLLFLKNALNSRLLNLK